ncbi:wax ester/triacylglycerol synthase domain-containing protein [Nocardia miyunensis]|uniref:wax ester/triacylglycerol synthase domain-containing protein n=1 Tax=Nocardia miyunensis TaxID=282684 RepID=UPI0008350751|nr:wax ester/triacylglycerol synthase domain-containing protein [Nocardia miyunensis]
MTDPREYHLSQSDLFSWTMERDAILRSTVVSILILDAAPEVSRLLRTVDRASRVAPKFRDRLVALPIGLAPPRWTPDTDFDLSWHVRHIALPASTEVSSVLEFARYEAMTAFDPVRPLWQLTLLTGLTGGKAALVLKFHHSLSDGLGGIQLANEIVDFTRSASDRGPAPERPRARPGELADILAWNRAVGSALARGGLARLLPLARRAVRDPLRTIRDSAAMAVSFAHLVWPVTDTWSPVMTKRGLGRRFATLDVPVAQLREAAHGTGCTINDAFLAAIVLGSRAYHARHGADIERLRVTMPISLRKAGDPVGGNRLTLARLALPADTSNPADLMRALHTVVVKCRREPAMPYSAAAAAALNRLPVGMVGAMLKHVDFVASNVPGSPVPMYIAGAEIERMYAFGPTIGTAFNVILISHAGTCCVGINADTAAVPDPDVLRECLAGGFRAVLGEAAHRADGIAGAQRDVVDEAVVSPDRPPHLTTR